MFDTFLLTIHSEDDTRPRYVSSAIFEILINFVGHSFEQRHQSGGASHSRMNVHVSCMCLSRRTRKAFPRRKESAEKILHAFLGSVSVFKLT